MLGRQRSGSVVCRSCGRLVGVSDDKCFYCGARNPSLWGLSPLLRSLSGSGVGPVEMVIVACSVLYVASLAIDIHGMTLFRGFGILAPSGKALMEMGASGGVAMIAGRWWTVLSAGWLHGGLIHIFFNLYWVRLLLPPALELYGIGRTVVIYTASSVVGFILSSGALFLPDFLQAILGGGGITVGASAPIFGLLGALIYGGRRRGASAFTQQILTWAALLFVVGFLFPNVDNWAHLGGFGGGYLIARLFDPMKPERTDHLILAGVCLIATVLSVVASLLVPLPEWLVQALMQARG